ncbi:MAG: IS5 family transposase [Chloroflexota bacterium]
MDLTDEQWDVIKSLIPEPPQRADGRGRPRRDDREILNGILWIMRTGAPWKDMPERYPPYQTCHRRFQEWVRSGTFEGILKALVQDMKERGDLDLTECFIDGTFVIAKKGAKGVGKTKRGKGTKIMAVADRSGLPVAISVSSASPHEITLVEATLDTMFTTELPERLIGDKAYDSDPLDEKLAENGVELIAPHRSNRKKGKTQDGRKLRRYRRRWKIERLFAWLQNYRRILVRFDRLVENYIGFVHLGCLVILLRHYF